jgi:hypothetical protein
VEPGQRGREAEHTTHVGQAPAVDRLVVVADEEDPVGRRGEEQRQVELRAVEVLRLVDEEVRARGAPSDEQGWGLAQPVERPTDQVVEVELAALGQRAFIGDPRARDRARLWICCDDRDVGPEIELEPREGRVQPGDCRRVQVRCELADECRPVDEVHLHGV